MALRSDFRIESALNLKTMRKLKINLEVQSTRRTFWQDEKKKEKLDRKITRHKKRFVSKDSFFQKSARKNENTTRPEKSPRLKPIFFPVNDRKSKLLLISVTSSWARHRVVVVGRLQQLRVGDVDRRWRHHFVRRLRNLHPLVLPLLDRVTALRILQKLISEVLEAVQADGHHLPVLHLDGVSPELQVTKERKILKRKYRYKNYNFRPLAMKLNIRTVIWNKKGFEILSKDFFFLSQSSRLPQVSPLGWRG